MPKKKKPRILIVDDDPIATGALSHVFGKAGISVEVSAEGNDALEKAKNSAFDLVILDIKLPLSDVSGWEVLEKLKSDERTSALPVYVLSNAGLQHQVERGLELGADAYLLKAHTSIHDLVERVREALSPSEDSR